MLEQSPVVLRLKICVQEFIKNFISDRLFIFSDLICNLISACLVMCVIYFLSGLHVFVIKAFSFMLHSLYFRCKPGGSVSRMMTFLFGMKFIAVSKM